VIPPTPYVILVVDDKDEGIPRTQLLFFRPNPGLDATRFEAKTDAQGRFRLPKKRWHGDWVCHALTPGGIRSQGFVGDFEPSKGYVEIKGKESIAGLVEGSDGEPIDGAQIEVRHRMKLGPPLEVATTDAQGRFSFESLSASLKVLTFKVRKNGYQLRDIEIDLHSDDALVLKAVRGRPLILDVLLPDGQPAVGLEVSIPGHPFLPAQTDPQGRVRFDGLAPGKAYAPKIVHPTYTYLLPRAVHASQKALTIRLEKPLTLEAFAKDRDGNSLKDLLITHFHGPRLRTECRTDSKGHFRLEGLPSGTARLHYQLPSGEPAEYEILMRKDMGEPILKLW
jgi:Carboxypeptidase regulatory-like domain